MGWFGGGLGVVRKSWPNREARRRRFKICVYLPASPFGQALAFSLVGIKIARKPTQVFRRLTTNRKSMQVLLFTSNIESQRSI